MFKNQRVNLHSRRGFTLVELIVVLVILGVTAAIAVPALSGYIDNGRQQSVLAEAHAAVTATQTLCSSKYQAGGFDDPAEYLRTWYGRTGATGDPIYAEEYHIYDGSTPIACTKAAITAVTDADNLLHNAAPDANGVITVGTNNVVPGHIIDFTCDDTGMVTWLVYQSGDTTVVYSAGGGGIGTAPAAPTPTPTIPAPYLRNIVKLNISVVDGDDTVYTGVGGTVTATLGSLTDRNWLCGGMQISLKDCDAGATCTFTVDTATLPDGYAVDNSSLNHIITAAEITAGSADIKIILTSTTPAFQIRIHTVNKTTNVNLNDSGVKLKITGDGLGNLPGDELKEWTTDGTVHTVTPQHNSSGETYTVSVEEISSSYSGIDPSSSSSTMKVVYTITDANITAGYADIYLYFVPTSTVSDLVLGGSGVTVTIGNIAAWPTDGSTVTYKHGQYVYCEDTSTYYVMYGSSDTIEYSTSGKTPDDYEWSLSPVKVGSTQKRTVWREGTAEVFDNGTPYGGLNGISPGDLFVTESGAVYYFPTGGPSCSHPENASSGWIKLCDGSGTGLYDQTFTVTQSTSNVTITPVNSTDNSIKLSGAKLSVKNAAGKIVAIWTSTDSEQQLSLYLADGKYTITEDAGKVPEHHKTTADTSFTVSGNATVLVPYDLKTGTLTVTFCDKDRTTLTAEGSFIITGTATNGQSISIECSFTGTKALTVPIGTYTLTSCVAPDGYAFDRVQYGTGTNVVVNEYYTPACTIYCNKVDTNLTFKYASNANSVIFPDRKVALLSSAETLPVKHSDGTSYSSDKYAPDNFIYQAPTALADLFNNIQLLYGGSTALTYTTGEPSGDQFTVTNPGDYRPDVAGSCMLTIKYNKSVTETLYTTLNVRTFAYQQYTKPMYFGVINFPYALSYEFYQIRMDDNKTGTYAYLRDGTAVLKGGNLYLCCNECDVTVSNWLTNYGSFGQLANIDVITNGSDYLKADGDTANKSIPSFALYYKPNTKELYEVRKGQTISAGTKLSSKLETSTMFSVDEWGWYADTYNVQFNSLLEGSDDEYLSGIQYTLKNSAGDTVDTWTSGTAAHGTNLVPGTYSLVETLPCENYKASSTNLSTVTVTAETSDIKLHYSFHLTISASFTPPAPALTPTLRVDRIIMKKDAANVYYGAVQATYSWTQTNASLKKELKLVAEEGPEFATDTTLNILLGQRYYLTEFELGDYVLDKPISFTVALVDGKPVLRIYDNNNATSTATTTDKGDYDLVLTNMPLNLNSAMMHLYQALVQYAVDTDKPQTQGTEIKSITNAGKDLLVGLSAADQVALANTAWTFSGSGKDFNTGATSLGLDADNLWRLYLVDKDNPSVTYFCTGGTYAAASDPAVNVFLCQMRGASTLGSDGSLSRSNASGDVLNRAFADGWFIIGYPEATP